MNDEANAPAAAVVAGVVDYDYDIVVVAASEELQEQQLKQEQTLITHNHHN